MDFQSTRGGGGPLLLWLLNLCVSPKPTKQRALNLFLRQRQNLVDQAFISEDIGFFLMGEAELGEITRFIEYYY